MSDYVYTFKGIDLERETNKLNQFLKDHPGYRVISITKVFFKELSSEEKEVRKNILNRQISQEKLDIESQKYPDFTFLVTLTEKQQEKVKVDKRKRKRR